MVSLAKRVNAGTAGAVYFSESVNDDRDLLEPADLDQNFRPLTTIPIFCLHLLGVFALEAATVVLTVLQSNQKEKCDFYFIISYIHIVWWIFSLVIDLIVRAKHITLKLNGYLDLLNRTENHNLPLIIASVWNTILLLVQTCFQQYFADKFVEQCLTSGSWSPVTCLCLFITVEFYVIIAIDTKYIIKVYQFNKAKPKPDVLKEEWLACSHPEGFSEADIGFQLPSEKINDLIAKQADLIRHLEGRNELLSAKIMMLNAESQSSKRRTIN